MPNSWQTNLPQDLHDASQRGSGTMSLMLYHCSSTRTKRYRRRSAQVTGLSRVWFDSPSDFTKRTALALIYENEELAGKRFIRRVYQHQIFEDS